MSQIARLKAPKDPPPDLANIDAERGVLGRILADDRTWFDVGDRLAADDFSDSRHRTIFRGMKALIESGRVIMRQTLLSQIGDDGKADTITLAAYLAALRAESPPPDALGDLIASVLHSAGRRALVRAANKVIEHATNATLEVPIEDVKQDAQRFVSAVDDESPQDAVKLGDLVGRVILKAHQMQTNERPAGIRSSFRPWDDLVGTLLPGQMIVLGGETSMGKTALATQIGILYAQAGTPVLMTSLEMEGEEIAARVLATFCEVSADRIVDGNANAAEMDRVMQLGASAIDLPFWIDSRPGQTVGTIQARTARAQARHRVGLVIIDHLQYVKPDDSRADERVQIKQVADGVKAMAKRLHIPVILLSHVARSIDMGMIHRAADIRRPTLKDLYGSSAIEKSADRVVFVHRPSWFLERVTAGRYAEECEVDKIRWEGKAEIILNKRRDGKGHGIRECFYNERLTWFSEFNPVAEEAPDTETHNEEF